MNSFVGFEHGMGIGGWLTNYKRFNCLPEDKRLDLTVGDFEHFQSYITEKDIAYIQSLGMDHIRFGFDQIVVANPDGTFRPEIIGLLKDFASWCHKYGLNIVFNLHKAIGNYCDIEEKQKLLDDEKLQAGFIRFWLNMEEAFADDNTIAFELLNEVRDVNAETWNNLAEKTLHALRQMNKDRLVIIGGTHWNSPDHLGEMRLYDDDRVAYTFHTYAPFSFTHQRGVLQALTLYYNREMPYPGDIERYRDFERVVGGKDHAFPNLDRMDRRYIAESLQGAVNFVRQHPDKVLWCGEFGTIRHAKIQWRENWMRDVISVLKENRIPYCVWNYLSTPNDGNRFSLVDDDSREILSSGLAKIIKGDF